MKKYLLSLFGVLCLGIMSGPKAEAIAIDSSRYKEGSYTIEFKSSTSTTQLGNEASVLGYITSGAAYVASYSGTNVTYQGPNGIRIGKTSAAPAGSSYAATFNLSAQGQVKVAAITVNATSYTESAANSTNYTVSVNGVQVGSSVTTKGTLTDNTFELSALTDLQSVTINPNKAVYIKSITVKYAIDKEAHGLSFPAATAEMTVGHSEIPLTLSNPKNLAITWTSSNPEVATVASNGTVTALKGGQSTITATTSGTTDIAAGSVSYTLNVAEENQEPAGMSVKADVVKAVYGQSLNATANIENPNNLESIEYKSSNSAVATVNKVSGVILIKGVGSTVITATYAGGNGFKPGVVSYTLEVAKAPVTLTWAGGTTSLNLGEAFVAPTLQMQPASLLSQVNKTFSGNLYDLNGSVALKAGMDGNGKVVATFESPYYESATATFEVNVTDPNAFEESFNIASFDAAGTGFNYANGNAAFADSKINIAGYLINNKGDIQLGPNSYLWLNANPLGLKISKITLSYGKANDQRVRVIVTGSDKVEESAEAYTNEICNYIHEVGETEYVIRPTGDVRSFYLRASGAMYLNKVTIQYQQLEPGYTFEKSSYTAYTDGLGWQSPRLLNAPEGLTLTYTSSKPNVATVDAAGVVTIAGDDGTTVIKAENAATKIFKAYSTTTEITAEKVTTSDPGLSFGDVTELTTEYGKEFAAPEFQNPNSQNVTFTSSNTSVATIDNDGNIKIVGVGSTTITAATEGDRDYRAGEVSYVLNVTKGKVTLSWSKADDLNLTLGDNFEAPVLTVKPAAAQSYVKYTSKGNLSVINNKVVLAADLDGAGEVAAYIESDLYEHVEPAVYMVEVLDPNKVHDVLLVKNFPNAGSGANYAIATGSGDNSISGVEYSARVVNNNGNFQMNSDGIWISSNKNDLTISKITLLFADNTAKGRTATIYGSEKVEANTTDYSTVLATFTKTDADDEFEYRFTSENYKSFFISFSGASYVEEVVVQYRKIDPVYTFAKPEYEVHLGDNSWVAPVVNNAPEGLVINYSTDNSNIAEYVDGVLDLYREGSITVTAANDAQGIYNAYQTSYSLNVLPELKNELGKVNVSINGEREIAENNSSIDVTVNDEVIISVLNATEMTVKVGDNSYTATVADGIASCTIPVTTQAEYNVTVIAKNENFDSTTTFTLNATYDESKVIGENFYMNGDAIEDEVSSEVYVGIPIVFEIENATNFKVNGSSIGATTTYTYTPTEIGTVELELEATDVYGVSTIANITLDVTVPLVETLNFVTKDYGMVRLGTNNKNTVLTGTSYTYTVNNQTRLLDGTTGLRIYAGATISVAIPEGYVIVSVTDVNGKQFSIDGLTTTIAADKRSATLTYTGNSAAISGLRVDVAEYTAPNPDDFTPSIEHVQSVKNSDGSFTVSITHENLVGAYLYYKLTYRFPTAQRRVAGSNGENAYDDEYEGNYQRAEANGDTHTFTVPQAGVVRYYAYDPVSGTVGQLEKVRVEKSGNVTSIEEIEAGEESEGEVYDLQGRRIAKPTRGLFIQNGVKVLIRK